MQLQFTIIGFLKPYKEGAYRKILFEVRPHKNMACLDINSPIANDHYICESYKAAIGQHNKSSPP